MIVKKNIFYTILIVFMSISFSLIFLTNNVIYANIINDISLDVPEKVAKGDAFIVNFKSAKPVKFISFSWNEREYTIPTKLIDNIFTASFLLPVSLVEESGSQILTIRSLQENLENIEQIPALSKTITFYEKNRPVEKLKVDKKYFNPSKEQSIRIKKDREKFKIAKDIFQTDTNLTLPLLRPVNGSISSVFGIKRVYNNVPRSYHQALDLRGATGTPIRAAANGRVVLAESTFYSGNVIFLDHGYGVMTTYSHMSKFKSVYGQSVQRGDIIGYVGSTGLSTGPHLHFALIVLGEAVDPLPFVEDKQKRK